MFAGNIIADPSIALNTAASIPCGRAIDHVRAVTMDTNTISNDCDALGGTCGTGDFGSNGYSGGDDAVTPLPIPLPATGLLRLVARGGLRVLRTAFRKAA